MPRTPRNYMVATCADLALHCSLCHPSQMNAGCNAYLLPALLPPADDIPPGYRVHRLLYCTCDVLLRSRYGCIRRHTAFPYSAPPWRTQHFCVRGSSCRTTTVYPHWLPSFAGYLGSTRFTGHSYPCRTARTPPGGLRWLFVSGATYLLDAVYRTRFCCAALRISSAALCVPHARYAPYLRFPGCTLPCTTCHPYLPPAYAWTPRTFVTLRGVLQQRHVLRVLHAPTAHTSIPPPPTLGSPPPTTYTSPTWRVYILPLPTPLATPHSPLGLPHMPAHTAFPHTSTQLGSMPWFLYQCPQPLDIQATTPPHPPTAMPHHHTTLPCLHPYIHLPAFTFSFIYLPFLLPWTTFTHPLHLPHPALLLPLPSPLYTTLPLHLYAWPHGATLPFTHSGTF